jgi:hypothetical protein
MREGYIREGPDHIDDPMIMNVARACVACGRRRLYPDAQCVRCTMNPALYTTQTRANLMRVNAALKYNDKPLQNIHRAVRRSCVIMVGVCIALIVGLMICSRLTGG